MTSFFLMHISYDMCSCLTNILFIIWFVHTYLLHNAHLLTLDFVSGWEDWVPERPGFSLC